MDGRDKALTIAALAAIVLLWPKKASANNPSGEVLYLPPSDEWWPAPVDYDPIFDPNFDYFDMSQLEPLNPWEWTMTDTSNTQIPNAMPADRLAAFSKMIRVLETGHAAEDSGLSYFTFYGHTTFFNSADHPVITGEKVGVRLSEQMCRDAGYNPGCVSTAAGGYQIIKPTWERVRKAGSWGPRLPDFSPESQDEAARRILIEQGALLDVINGNFREAIAKVSPIWASLPGNKNKQNPQSMDYALSVYSDALYG